jgi:ABC-2 type transport system permease protein
MTLKAYILFFQNALSQELSYRLNFVVGRLRLIVLFFALVWLWLAVFSHRVGGGYDTAHIFSYLIVVNLLFDVVVQNQQERIADDIVEGRVNSYLTRPISYFFAMAASSLAMRFLVLCTIPFLWIFYRLFFHDYPLVFSTPMLPVFFVGACLSVCIAILCDFLNGCSAFWFHRAYGPRWLFLIVSLFSTGVHLPLTLLPKALQTILFLTPFPAMIFLPASLLVGTSPFSVLETLGMQLFWVVMLSVAAFLVWRRGMKR